MTPTTSARRRRAASSRPAWSIDLTLGQMRKLRAPAPDANTMVDSHRPRATKDKDIAGDWQARAAKIVADSVYPALDRQIALMEQLKPTSRPGDGAQRLPQWRRNLRRRAAAGDDHQFHAGRSPPARPRPGRRDQRPARHHPQGRGLHHAARSASGSTRSTPTPAQLYAEHRRRPRRADRQPQRRRQGHVCAALPRAFATLPTQPLEIRRVPVEIQDGASNGYYRRAALDGSRPAIYFINLKDVGDWPKYSLPALTYHEGVPGHHLQISIAQESKDIPTLAQDRRLLGLFRRLGALCRAGRRRAWRL